jgi:lysophospholipase L1-like esterase
LAEAAKRPDVHWVDLHPIFDAPDGGYADEVNRSDGTPVTARARDGVHLSEDGADLLAPVLAPLIATEWGLG